MVHYVPLVRGNQKHIVTIHDLSELLFPETISLAWRNYNRASLVNAVRRARAIITVSESVRQELLGRFQDLDPSSVHVCRSGIRDIFFTEKPDPAELDTLHVAPESYFLFVGDLTKRKNLQFLLETFIKGKADRRIRPETKLVLAGKRSWGYSEFRHLLREDLGITIPGYVTERQLVALYRYSKGVILPSLYEGFGSPIVEAMSQGTPLIVSRIATSMELAERHNRQMLTFDLGSREQLSSALEHLDRTWTDVRNQLSYGDVSQYSYDRIAEEHVKVYRRILD